MTPRQAHKDSEKTFYQVLGVDPAATKEEITKAYRRLAMKFHPDKNKDVTATAEFVKIGKAYTTLSDPAARQEYDLSLREPAWSHDPAGVHFDLSAAENLFAHLFSNVFQDAMFPTFVDMPTRQRRRAPTRGPHDVFGSMFAFGDDLFADAFDGHALGSGTSVMHTTTTQVINGHAVSRTEKVVRHADGRVDRTVSETVGGRPVLPRADGQPQRRYQLEAPTSRAGIRARR